MNRTQVKFCGMMRDADIEAVNLLRPDLVGFVFAPGRRRTISHAQAERFRSRLDSAIPAVGVFVDAPIAEICALADAGIIQQVQLHGAEDAAYCSALRARCNLPVIQAFHIASLADLQFAEASVADFLLLDHGIGGTGKTFDHTLLTQATRPYFLAGGLSHENVAEILRTYAPAGLDVSSGIETNGTKDFEKMQRFLHAVRGQNASHAERSEQSWRN